jgi:hypothetical protein
MSLEDDQEFLAKKIKESMGSIMAGQPDVLVFCLTGKEIQALLLAMAESCESEAKRQILPENVKPIRSYGKSTSMSGLPGMQVRFEPHEEQQMRAMAIAMANERAEIYRGNAKTYRFLAGHVEEDRYFRLSVPDLNFLGLVPQGISGTSHLPPTAFHSGTE